MRRRRFSVGFEGFELGKLLLDGFGRVEEETDVGLDEHRGVVEGIAGGDNVVIQFFEGGDGFGFLI